MKVHVLVILVLYLVLPKYTLVEGARVLAVLPIFAKSHHNFFQPVLKALASAGHEVVVYSPFPLDNPVPNYTDVYLDDVQTENDHITSAFLTAMETPAWKCIDLVEEFTKHMIRDFMGCDKLQKLLSSKEHFDIVITEFFGGQEIMLLYGHVFKAPVISLQSYVTNSIANSVFGNTLSLSYIPDVCTPFSNKMNFYERALNSVYMLRGLYYVYYQRYLPNLEYTYNRLFPNGPPLLDMAKNISLIIVNDHLTADYARPRTPNIIPVAGIHIEEPKQLPQRIKRFMDEATDGVIFFSLGTYVPDERQPQEYFDMHINVFRQLKQRVLWKTRKENIQGLPKNVMTVKWAPQRDILGHPNSVLFITHGGLLSQHETVYCGVPVVAIPHFWDQQRNAKFYEEQGIGVRLNPQELSSQNILAAIQKVLGNPEYTTNIKRLSQVFQDRPMTPAETVVYWTEYVLRHGGAPHLRPASTQLSWYQLALLDVLALILALLFSMACVVYFMFRKLIVFIYCKRKLLMQINKNTRD